MILLKKKLLELFLIKIKRVTKEFWKSRSFLKFAISFPYIRSYREDRLLIFYKQKIMLINKQA